MEFHDKLRKLRKEQGMSQEELAQQLNVSRQAVSKWESGQGFPETDKLLIIGNIFHISMDYLLKDTPSEDASPDAEPGYYVNREMAQGYLAMKRQGAKRIALGVAVIILAISFAVLFDDALGAFLFFLSVAAGVAILVLQGFQPKRYEVLEQQPLVFDEDFLREFRTQCAQNHKQQGLFIVVGILLIIASFACAVLVEDVLMLPERYEALYPIFWAAGTAILIFNGSAIIAADVLAKNKEHMKELEDENRTSWIFGAGFLLAGAVFLFFGLVQNNWHPAWVVFPLTGLICAAISTIINARER